MSTEATPIWLIVPSKDRAVVLRVAGNAIAPFVAEASDETPLAKVIAKVFLEQEYDAQPILLAPRSTDVLAVSLPPMASMNRQAMLYELEEYVPIPAERFVADIFSHEKEQFAGVIDTEKFLPLIDELAAQEILIQAIVPLSVIVAQYLTQSPITIDGIRAVLWSYEKEPTLDDGRIELFFLTADGLPLSWQLLDEKPDSLRRAFETEILVRDVDISVESPHLPEELRAVSGTIPRVTFVTNEPVNDEETGNLLLLAIAKQSDAILSRKKRPWWDFRRDGLAMRGTDRILGKSIRMTLWGSVALVTALCLVLGVRMYKYDSLASQYRQEQEAAFREALPDQQLQTGFRNRLESEHVKMSAQRENTTDIPQRESVLVPLLKILQSLPKPGSPGGQQVRYRFPEIRIEPNTAASTTDTVSHTVACIDLISIILSCSLRVCSLSFRYYWGWRFRSAPNTRHPNIRLSNIQSLNITHRPISSLIPCGTDNR